MPQNFIACDRDQTLLMPPDIREWLPEGHLAWFVLDAVVELDLEPFRHSYRADGHGRAAFDPEMMVALLLYSYAVGERSSRKIERRCTEDVAFRVIAANQSPDHATIARFRARHQKAIGELFGEVLNLCARAGLLGGNQIAIDSTKLAADASGAANHDYGQIAERILAEAEATDRIEDERHGAARGDELPPELCDPTQRRQWLRDQRHQLAAEQKRAAAERRPHPSSRPERLAEASRRLQLESEVQLAAAASHRAWRADREAELQAQGKKMTGRPPRPEATGPAAEPKGRINSTDLDSQSVRSPRGFIQGYNAHVASTEGQIVVAAELSLGSGDGGRLEPMVAAAEAELGSAGAGAPEVVLADGGYWSSADIGALGERGVEALVPPESRRKKGSGPSSRRAPPYEQMRAKLESERGGGLYAKRQWMVEPVFAQIKVGRRADRFQRRGLVACDSEWKLITATHNLLKLWRAQNTPLTA